MPETVLCNAPGSISGSYHNGGGFKSKPGAYQALHQPAALGPDLLDVPEDVDDAVLLGQLDVGVDGQVHPRPSGPVARRTKRTTGELNDLNAKLGAVFKKVGPLAYLQWTMTGPSWLSGWWFITFRTRRRNSSKALEKGLEWQGHSV